MNLKEERKLWRKGFKKVLCLDEAGRGPLAGPVTAVAVIVRPAKVKSMSCTETKFLVWGQKSKVKNILREMRDSKKLSPKKREKLHEILIKHPAIEWGIGRVGNKVIDRINILEATKLAMQRAIKNSKLKCQMSKMFLIVDGNMKIDLDIPQKAIVKADNRVFSCAAASVIAKVTRDRTMRRYHKKYPQYGFDKHKGYPTKYHKRMLKKYGPCKIHRKSFAPVRTCLSK